MVFNRDLLHLLSLGEREHKFRVEDAWRVGDDFPILENTSLDLLSQEIIAARNNDLPVIWMMGAHPIRRGNSLLIIDLIQRGIITHVATSGAGAIHDLEFAMIGATCEDVARYIQDGSFGNWEETGLALNSAVNNGVARGWGFGKSVGEHIACRAEFPNAKFSIFANAVCCDVPITVHKGIGFDITDQHPSADYAALGQASGQDFLIFADSMRELVRRGGVFLNFGSAVMGPEVFLKALSMARNVELREGKEPQDFITANFDLCEVSMGDEGKPTDPDYYYRPKKTILVRSVSGSGKSFHIAGDFRTTIPNLYTRIVKGE